MEKWFSKALAGWYGKNKRDLPWRKERDPYKIWLSEIILQQTQVAQGLSYYLSFTAKYPTVTKLAKAPEDEVLRLWQGLGYYSRARNLHASAKNILNDFNGVFPGSYVEIKSLRGVGDYTAAAIASFAYDLPHAVLDGNVYRLLSRVFGIRTPINSPGAKKEFQELADQLLDRKDPATHNQAIMEFGSQFCKPVKPDCENCILRNKCYAFKTLSVTELPVKAKKTKVRNRYFNYVVIFDRDKEILINKRHQQDIWQGLYEFKLIETEKEISHEQLLKTKELKEILRSQFTLKHVSKTYKHILSHQHLYAKFYVIVLPSKFKSFTTLPGDKMQQTKVSLEKLPGFAFPRLIGKFLDDCDLKEML
jgi:A/G-specific adenine glycosylase